MTNAPLFRSSVPSKAEKKKAANDARRAAEVADAASRIERAYETSIETGEQITTVLMRRGGLDPLVQLSNVFQE